MVNQYPRSLTGRTEKNWCALILGCPGNTHDNNGNGLDSERQGAWLQPNVEATLDSGYDCLEM